jgi:hypothetical protein
MKVGDIVECVNANFPADRVSWIPNRPKAGSFYLVREYWDAFLDSGTSAVRLEEIVNPEILTKDGFFLEPVFKAERFRLVEGLEEVMAEVETIVQPNSTEA